MKISKSVKNAMCQLSIDKLRKFQIEPINSILDKNDTLVIAPTSAGKSAIYQIPAIIKNAKGKWTLVIEPTLALIADQVNKLRELRINAEMLTGRNRDDHYTILNRLSESKIAVLYVTPERLQTKDFLAVANDTPPWLVVADEAYCLLDWGYTFRSAYLGLKSFLKDLQRRPVVAAFTATAPPEYRATICNLLGMKKPVIYASSLERNNIILLKEDCSGYSLKKRLVRVNYNIKKYGKGGRVVVYCATRKNVDMTANYLSKRFPGEVAKCHAYMDTDKREKHEMQFINGSKRIIVATTAFGMGISVPDIRLVLHFNLPLSTIDYYQQIGRSGRDGEKSHAMLLYHPDDIALNQKILDIVAREPELFASYESLLLLFNHSDREIRNFVRRNYTNAAGNYYSRHGKYTEYKGKYISLINHLISIQNSLFAFFLILNSQSDNPSEFEPDAQLEKILLNILKDQSIPEKYKKDPRIKIWFPTNGY